MGDYLRQYSPGAPITQPREAGAGSWVTVESTDRTEVCMLLPNAQAGKTPLGFLGIWPWIPQFPQRHFYLWIDARLLLLEGQNEGHLIRPCC